MLDISDVIGRCGCPSAGSRTMTQSLHVLAICFALGVSSAHAQDATRGSRHTPQRLPDIVLDQPTPPTPPGVPVPYPNPTDTRGEDERPATPNAGASPRPRGVTIWEDMPGSDRWQEGGGRPPLRPPMDGEDEEPAAPTASDPFYPSPPLPLHAPIGLRVAVGQDGIGLAWVDNSVGESGFEFSVATNARRSGFRAQPGFMVNAEPGWVETGPRRYLIRSSGSQVPGTCFRVRAVRRSVVSAWSNTACLR